MTIFDVDNDCSPKEGTGCPIFRPLVEAKHWDRSQGSFPLAVKVRKCAFLVLSLQERVTILWKYSGMDIHGNIMGFIIIQWTYYERTYFCKYHGHCWHCQPLLIGYVSQGVIFRYLVGDYDLTNQNLVENIYTILYNTEIYHGNTNGYGNQWLFISSVLNEWLLST